MSRDKKRKQQQKSKKKLIEISFNKLTQLDLNFLW